MPDVAVLIADRVAGSVAGQLRGLGAKVEEQPTLGGSSLTRAMTAHQPEVLIVRSTHVTAADLRASSALALVVRAGAGANTIDLDVAAHDGIQVATCPGQNAAAVAELTFGHLLNLDRRLVDNVNLLREGHWRKSELRQALGLMGRTLAVLGCGAVGRAVISRAKAFGMRVKAWSRSLRAEHARALGVDFAPDPIRAVRDAHAVTVHLALTEETRGLIDREVFAAMRPGAYFVNTSRGAVVDAEALAWALEHRRLRAGLDVFDPEPAGGRGTFEHPLRKHPLVYGTHHIGASTQQALEAIGQEVVRIVSAYLNGQPIPHCVDLATFASPR